MHKDHPGCGVTPGPCPVSGRLLYHENGHECNQLSQASEPVSVKIFKSEGFIQVHGGAVALHHLQVRPGGSQVPALPKERGADSPGIAASPAAGADIDRVDPHPLAVADPKAGSHHPPVDLDGRDDGLLRDRGVHLRNDPAQGRIRSPVQGEQALQPLVGHIRLQLHRQIVPEMHQRREVQPVLKQKGIKSWKFKWEISDDYDYNPKEYTHGYWSISGGGATREGTMYFIPKENKDLGDKTFSAIDSLTFNYISNNYEQDFYYRSNQHNEAKTAFVPNELRHILSAHFNIDNGDRVEVLVGYTEAGYYIVVSENNGSNGFPVEWYALKSFNNGKKEYIKGAKK